MDEDSHACVYIIYSNDNLFKSNVLLRSFAKRISELNSEFFCKEDSKEIIGTTSSSIHGSTGSSTCSSSCI